MQQKQIDELLKKYADGTASAEERALVETWYLYHEPAVNFVPAYMLEKDKNDSLNAILAKAEYSNRKKIRLILAAAASLIFAIGLSGYFLLLPKKSPVKFAVHNKQQDLLPGGNKATLTLANGSVIALNDAKKGTLASQGNTKINKTSEGVISYAGKSTHAAITTLVYNTASTPRGGQYQFILSDGTKVWLNAASSIKFPVAFASRERSVELTGEAYFEVAHDANKPFRVVSNGQIVEVLGTHFNINAYGDDHIVKTTLLEGSVRISAGSQIRVIKPGEQAQVKNSDGVNVVEADVDDAVAWKNGYFHFEDNTIQEIALQLSRWYDVDITYEGQLPQRRFSGEIPRNVTASQLMNILSLKTIHYRIEGKSLVILP